MCDFKLPPFLGHLTLERALHCLMSATRDLDDFASLPESRGHSSGMTERGREVGVGRGGSRGGEREVGLTRFILIIHSYLQAAG